MPRLRRRKHRRRTEYNEHHRSALLTGNAYFCFRTKGDLRNNDLVAMREAWEYLKDGLLPEFIEENPGERPWAWWEFDSPERRLRTDDKPHPFDNPGRIKYCQEISEKPGAGEQYLKRVYNLTYGRPSNLVGYDDSEAVYESDVEYLFRLNLLTVEERELFVEEVPSES